MSESKPRQNFLRMNFLRMPDMHLFQLEGDGPMAFWFCPLHDEEMGADPEDGWPIDCVTCERAAGFMLHGDERFMLYVDDKRYEV